MEKKKISYSSFKSFSPTIQPSVYHSICLPLNKIKIRNILLELKFIVNVELRNMKCYLGVGGAIWVPLLRL